MKKWIALFLAAACLISLAACAAETPAQTTEAPQQTTEATHPATEAPQPGGVQVEEVFKTAVSWAGAAEDGRIFSESLNPETMAISAVRHLPIHKFDTKADLDQFMAEFGEVLDLENGYDEVPSFRAVTAGYDEAFFEENTLMLVYVSANSGTYRYEVNGIYCSAPDFSIHVAQANDPTEVTDDMAGWFITVTVPDSMLAGCSKFDADLDNPLVTEPMPIAE